MFADRLTLHNFRNYETLSLDFENGTVIFTGDNGQGKTNILESIFYCAIGKSFRYGKDKELIRYGQSGFSIGLSVKNDITEKIDITYSSSQEKSVRVNGIYLRKLGHLIGSFLSVIFSPEDMKVINDGPSERRRMLDIAISQYSPTHYFNLQQYLKILQQKNILLRSTQASEKEKNKGILDVFNEQLSIYGAKIIENRIKYVNILESISSAKHAEISGGERLNLNYYSDCLTSFEPEKIPVISQSEIQNVFFKELEAKTEKEIERGQSLTGPHRDDLIILLNSVPVRVYGSQGQKRTAALSLKLSELQILEKKTGRKPVLLLDDVFSELDDSRCEMLLKSSEDFQTVITCTSVADLPEKVKSSASVYMIKNGTAGRMSK